jgi:cell division protein FtsB
MTKERAREILEYVWMRVWSGDDAWNEFESVVDEVEQLKKENNQLMENINVLLQENKDLKEENERLEAKLDQFTNA